jgi:hypothetical protein
MGRKRKHANKYDRILDPLLVGRPIGGAIEGCITRVEPRDRAGHLYVWVKWVECDSSCSDCHGEDKRHRYDKIKRGEVKSCGRLKRKLYAEHIKSRTQHPLIDVAGNPIPATARLKLQRPR